MCFGGNTNIKSKKHLPREEGAREAYSLISGQTKWASKPASTRESAAAAPSVRRAGRWRCGVLLMYGKARAFSFVLLATAVRLCAFALTKIRNASDVFSGNLIVRISRSA